MLVNISGLVMAMNSAKFITLDNGLKILIYSDKSKISNHAELITFIGGNSSSYINNQGIKKEIYPGTAHYLEHFVCEKNKFGNYLINMQKQEVLNSNAYTNNTRTWYAFDTVYNFKNCLKTLIDSVYNPVFNKENIDKTKYAVINEIRDSKDSFGRKIQLKKVKNIFSNERETLGDVKDIEKIDDKYLEDIYDSFYVPKNQFLVVAGSFDEDEIIDYIKEIYKKYTFHNNERKALETDKRKVVKEYDEIEGSDIGELIISYKIYDDNLSPFEKYKLDWYVNYFIDLNFSNTAEFNDVLKNKNIISGNISSCTYRREGYFVIEIYARPKDNDKLIKMVEEKIKSIDENSKKEFELCKKASKTRISVRKDSVSNYVLPIMDNVFSFDYYEDDTIEFVDTLDYEEYVNTIKNLDFSNRSILYVKNDNK